MSTGKSPVHSGSWKFSHLVLYRTIWNRTLGQGRVNLFLLAGDLTAECETVLTGPGGEGAVPPKSTQGQRDGTEQAAALEGVHRSSGPQADRCGVGQGHRNKEGKRPAHSGV